METEVILDCSSKQVSLNFSKEYNYTTDHVTEGDFHNFLFPEDNIVVVVQCISNVKRPMLRENVIASDTLMITGKKVFRSYGYESDSLHFWQEDVYLELPISIRIRNASSETFGPYQEIMDQIKIK
ncbi:MAG: hypothetical protein R8G66_33900 [Cytophagales bacterium]|nr:hypothetical protein [Cytophagales bacterium]